MKKTLSTAIVLLLISICIACLASVTLADTAGSIKEHDPSDYASGISGLPVIGRGADQTAEAERPALEAEEKTEDVPPLNSLLGSSLEITTNDVGQGSDLEAAAVIHDLSGTVICDAEWYLDGELLSTTNDLILRNGSCIGTSAEIQYSQDMELRRRIALKLSNTDFEGEPGVLYQELEFDIKNYSKAYYRRIAAAEAITHAEGAADVTSEYSGGGSSSYDVDYPDNVKTAFVNERGYSSRTEYLAWVSLSTQKVNIFQGSKGSWTLIHTFRCASGASSTPTPTGVTYVTQKQTAWVTDEYTVKNVTRFYPGSGYAFHSILYTPDGSRVKSGAMGYPVSHGCIRTEDAGVKWIYNNLPLYSTVVIY